MKSLTNVSETLWLPLFGKAIETKRPNPFISDPKAVEIAEKACLLLPELTKWWSGLSKETQALMIWRNQAIDRLVNDFIDRHPNATFVNLGAGLCTRFSRVDNGSINWLEFDLPDVKDVWLEFNQETDRHRYFTHSIFEEGWLEVIKQSSAGPVMFIAEGLLMYFNEQQVRLLLKSIGRHFSGGEIVAEIYSSIALKRPHPDVKKTSAERFPSPWGVYKGKDLEDWGLGLVHLSDSYLADNKQAMSRMPLFNKSMSKLPYFRKVGKIVHLQFRL